MTENQIKLIKLILENDNPEQALKVAAAIIDSLTQQETSEERIPACLETSYQTNPRS
jgi:hypothetical protein